MTATLRTPWEDGCRAGELRVQRCDDCGAHQFPPRPFCITCGADAPRWVATAGRATVTTWTAVHVALDPAWADRVPYLVALVRLDEGPTLMTNLVETDAPCIGQRVAVRFTDRDDAPPLPVFAPIDESPDREATP